MLKSEIIQEVIDLLAQPESWTKWAMARPVYDGGALNVTSYDDNYHVPMCNEGSGVAMSWCLSGALARISLRKMEGYDTYHGVWKVFNRLAKDRGFGLHGAVAFNNSPDTTHEDLMVFLKEALYDAQAEEARQNMEGVA